MARSHRADGPRARRGKIPRLPRCFRRRSAAPRTHAGQLAQPLLGTPAGAGCTAWAARTAEEGDSFALEGPEAAGQRQQQRRIQRSLPPRGGRHQTVEATTTPPLQPATSRWDEPPPPPLPLSTLPLRQHSTCHREQSARGSGLESGRRSCGQGGAAKGAPRPSGRESRRLLQATEAEPGARRRGGSSRALAPATRAGAQAFYGAAAESTAAARTLHGGHGQEDQQGGSSSSGVGRGDGRKGAEAVLRARRPPPINPPR